jgi:peptidoglycan/xylan/chitin deacetylase (PgdA/CDA1 family)
MRQKVQFVALTITLLAILFFVQVTHFGHSLITTTNPGEDFMIDYGTQIDSMDDMNNWTLAPLANGNTSSDTVNFIEGAQGVKQTILGDGLCCSYSMTKNLPDLNMSQNNAIHVWIHLDNVSNMSGMSILVGNTTNWSAYMQANINSNGLESGWNHVEIPMSHFYSTEHADTWNTEKKIIRIKADARTGSTLDITWDDLRVGFTTRPKAIITFDDGWESQYDNATPIMQANNQKGVEFVITKTLADEKNYPSYINVSKLRVLYNRGWDISSHTVTHPDLTTQNAEQLAFELNESHADLIAYGFTRSAMFIAYPQGKYNSQVLSAVQNAGYQYGRTTAQGDFLAMPSRKDPDNINERLPVLLVLNTTTPQQLTDAVNTTIEKNGLIIFVFHIITSDVLDESTKYSTSNFTVICNYLASRSADIDVITLSDFYGGIQKQ